MKFALLVVLALLPAWIFAQDPETKTFTEQFAGIQFNYPATWKTTKTEKDRVHLAIPVEGSTETAELQLVHTDYHADKDLWQTIQLRVNEQLGRQVVRQWEQEILGVPMLLTRINYTEKGVAKSALTGLYYARTPQKLLIRLEMREADYDNLTYAFFSTLESIRTTDGNTPVPDDPAVKLGPSTPVKPPPVVEPPRIISADDPNKKIEVPNQKVELTLGTRKVNLLYPDGWKAEATDGNTVTLRHDEVSEPVKIQMFTTVDGDSTEKALFKISSESLKLFEKVDMREDTNPTPNRAGAKVATTWRAGKGGGNPMASFEATGQVGDDYFLLTWQQPKGTNLKRERPLLQELVSKMTFEIVP